MGWTQHKERCDVGSCLHHWEHEGPLLKNVWFLLFFLAFINYYCMEKICQKQDLGKSVQVLNVQLTRRHPRSQ